MKLELETALIQEAKTLLDKYGTEIPDGGHMSICVWDDHISASIVGPAELNGREQVADCWADPRESPMTIYSIVKNGGEKCYTH